MATSSAGPAWRTITIEDGSPPVGFARLDRDVESGEFAALVRFPVGWERPPTGRYAVDEEFFVLEGEFHMSGVAYRVDDYAFFPAAYLRSGSAAPQGALLLAFFTGPADWVRAREDDSATTPVRPVAWRDVPPRGSPVAKRARPLAASDGRATWLVEGSFAARAPERARLQLFSIPTRLWATVAPGGPTPPMSTPCLCRLRTVPRGDAAGVDRDLSDK